MMKSIDFDLEELKLSFLAMVKSKSTNPKLIDSMKAELDSIIANGKLIPPDEEETDSFVNDFSPKLILKILRTKPKDKNSEIALETILIRYIKLFSILIVTDCDNFNQACRNIIATPRQNFYYKSMSYTNYGKQPVSQLYEKNMQLLATPELLHRLLDSFSKNEPFTIEKLKFIITDIVYHCRAYFQAEELENFITNVTNYFLSLFNNKIQPPFSEIDQLLTQLYKLSKRKTVQKTLETTRLTICIKILHTSILTQQFMALTAIKRILIVYEAERNEITETLQKEGFVQIITKGMHQELAFDFCLVFKEMIKTKTAGIEDIKSFWKLTVNQHPSVIEYFFKGWNTVVTAIESNLFNELINYIIEVDQFPEQALDFLHHNAIKINEYYKVKLCDILINKMISTENNDLEDAYIRTLESVIPVNDKQYCENLQKQCMDLINKNENISFALPILKVSCRSVSPSKAREYFSVVLKTLLNLNTVDLSQYTDLIIRIVTNFDDTLNAFEFEKLQFVLKKHHTGLGPFVYNLLKTHKSLFSPKMIRDIFNNLCESNNCEFSYIKNVFITINPTINLDNEVFGLDYLWKLEFRTANTELSDFLISLYENHPRMFIDHCSKDFTSVGSLKTILKYLRKVEDCIDLETFNIKVHQFPLEIDFANVSLTGDVNEVIRVPKDISYESMFKRICFICGKSTREVVLYYGDIKVTSQNFNVEYNIDVKYNAFMKRRNSDSFDTTIESDSLPSLILTEEKYVTILFKNIQLNDNIAHLSYLILNRIPTIKSELKLLSDFSYSIPDWREVLNQDKQFLLLYRVGIMGKFILSRDLDWLQTFFETKGFQSMFDIVIRQRLLVDDHDLYMVFKIVEMLLGFEEKWNNKNEILIDCFDIAVTSLFEQIREMKKNKTHSHLLLHQYIIFFHEFFKIDAKKLMQNPIFDETVDFVIFNPNRDIRQKATSILSEIPIELYQRYIIDLLPLSFNSRCDEYYCLLIPIAQSIENPDIMYKSLLQLIFDHFAIPKTKSVIDILLFRPPGQFYTSGLFAVFEVIMKRKKEIPDYENLFMFLLTDIMFNSLKYYAPSQSLYNVVMNMIDRYPELNNIVLPRIQEILDFVDYSQVRNKDLIVDSTVRLRGIKNLGATCYMNSTIQQLFNIREFRDGLFRSHFSHKDWEYQFQYVFAKLAFYPSAYIDISNFTKQWTDWDDNPINTHEQQDAVEFLQMLIERLDEKIHCSSLFEGKVVHRMVPKNGANQFECVEPFVTFPLEVKEHTCIEDSLKTFLIPDHFDDYKVLGMEGTTEADRYHRIRELPDILIIQLKRFEYNMSTQTREKVNSRYTFGETIDLSSIMENQDIPATFDLIGVIMHMGTAQSGHYYSHVKRDNGKCFTFNDTFVSKIDMEAMTSDSYGGKEYNVYNNAKIADRDSNAYLLFYRRRHVVCPYSSDRITGWLSSENDLRIARRSSFKLGDSFPSLLDINQYFVRNSSHSSLLVESSIEEDYEDSNKLDTITEETELETIMEETETEAETDTVSEETTEPISEEHEVQSLNIEPELAARLRSRYRPEHNQVRFIESMESQLIIVEKSHKDYLIDKKLIDRLILEIKQTVLQEIVISPIFSQLVLKVCFNDLIGHVMFSHISNCLRTSCKVESLQELKEQCFRLISQKSVFASYILEQRKEFSEFILESNDAEIRKFMASIIIEAIPRADVESVEEFSDQLKDEINGNATSLINNMDCIPEFSEIIDAVNSVTHDEEWIQIVTNFICNTVNQHHIEHKDKKVYSTINLGAMFTLIEKETNKKNQDNVIQQLFTSSNILNWLHSRDHSVQLASLIHSFIENNKEASTMFINLIKDVDKEMLAPQFAGYLIICLRMNDNFNAQRDEYLFKYLAKRSPSFVQGVFDDASYRAQAFEDKLTSHFLLIAKNLIKTFVFKSEYSTKINIERFIRSIFNKATTPSPQDSDLHIFFLKLIDLRPKMEAATMKFIESPKTENYPSAIYFSILKWVIQNGGFQLEMIQYAKVFVSSMKKLSGSSRAHQTCFSFIFEIIGPEYSEEFFKHASLSKFLESFGEISSITDIVNILDLISVEQSETLIKSEQFKSICSNGFNSDEKCSRKLKDYILRVINQDNMSTICSALWNESIFQKNAGTKFHIQYCSLTWEILIKFPAASNIIFKRNLHQFMWKRVQNDTKTSRTPSHNGKVTGYVRPVAKILAEFNNGYCLANKGQSFIFKGNKVDALVKYWKDEKVSFPDLLTASMVALPQMDGSSGLCEFMKSFVLMDQQFCTSIFKLFAAQKTGLIYRMPSDAQVAGVGLLSLICHEFVSKSESDFQTTCDLIIREFHDLVQQNLVKFKVVDTMCQQIQSMLIKMSEEDKNKLRTNVDSLFLKTKKVKMFSSTVIRVALEIGDATIGASWVEKVNGLLTQIIIDAQDDDADIGKIMKDVQISFDFIKCCCEKFDIGIPKVVAKKSELETILTKFASNDSSETLNISDQLRQIIAQSCTNDK